MSHLIYIDTEFTDLLAPVLLSIGMVCADGRRHYVELDRADPANSRTFAKAGEFVLHGGVLDQWGTVPDSTTSALEMGRRTGQFLLDLARQHGPLTLAFDYVTDVYLVEDCVRGAGLWDQVAEVVQPLDIGYFVSVVAAEGAARECFKQLRAEGLSRHHALADALALRAAHQAVFSQVEEVCQ